MFRPIKIRQYLELMKSQGHSAAAVLAGSGVTLANVSDADFLMNMEQAKTVVSNMIALSGDQGIGLEAGRRTEMMDLGLVGYAMMSATCARDAVHYWTNFSNSLLGMMIQIRLEERTPTDWSMVITESEPLGFIYNFCAEEMLMMIYKLGGSLTAEGPNMTQLELSYPSPSHQSLYKRYFKGPIKFNSNQTRISFCSPRLDQLTRGNDKEFNKLCARQCELMMRRIDNQSPYITKTRDVLMRLSGCMPSLESAAKELNISPRTLRRRLGDEGVSFQEVLRQFRLDMAKEYLRSSSITPKQISSLLGFSDTNSFRRAFKLWTGVTVGEYQRKR